MTAMGLQSSEDFRCGRDARYSVVILGCRDQQCIGGVECGRLLLALTDNLRHSFECPPVQVFQQLHKITPPFHVTTSRRSRPCLALRDTKTIHVACMISYNHSLHVADRSSVVKTHRDLEISETPSELEQFVHNIETLLRDGWSRYVPAEQDMCDDYYGFQCTPTPLRPAAKLWLTRRDRTPYVANVTPVEKVELTTNEYNAIAFQFYQDFVQPAGQNLSGIHVTLGKAEENLNDWMSEATAELLRTFTASANPSTGSSHPMDQERWNAFVIAAHRESASFNSTQLRQWLYDVNGWNDRVVSKLTIEYEQGRELLAQYDRSF